MNEQITIPADGIWILNRLQAHGYVGYAVGGCAGCIAARTPHDWDFCTSATPEQIQACFSDVPCLTIGSQHGTIGVLRNHTVYEITTFRKETTYHDHRHPDAVLICRFAAKQIYSGEILPSMRWHIIRNRNHRPFSWSSRLAETAAAMRRRSNRTLYRRCPADFASCPVCCGVWANHSAGNSSSDGTNSTISKMGVCGAILSECDRIVTVPYAAATLAAYHSIWFRLFPEMQPLQGFQQYHPRHAYDVWEHSLLALSHSDQQDTVLCWAALLHDIGKPACFHRDAAGIGHFYGHPAESAALAKANLQASENGSKANRCHCCIDCRT